MSKFQGGMIGSVANTPSGTAYTGRANGVWTLPHHIAAKSALLWAIGQTKPNPPTIGTAIGISGTSVSVAFIPPVVNGGDTITIYTVTSSGSQVGTGAASPIVVSGLTTGTAYTFTVTATNNLGTSVSSSASNSVTPISGDPYYSAVTLFLNGNGTNNSAVFSDLSSTPKSITVNGDSKSSTTQTKFNTTSMFFDGTGDYLAINNSTNFAFGTNNFTIECWLYQTSRATTYQGLFSTTGNSGSSWTDYNGAICIACHSSSSDNMFLGYNNGGAVISSGVPFSLNTWTHFAFVRSGTSFILYKDGINSTSLTLPSNFSFTSDGVNVIGKQDIRNNYYFTGYIDDFRVTKGIARYTANFTPSPFPPSSALMPVSSLSQADPYFSSVSLLLSGDSFTDLSSSPNTITNNNSITVNTTTKKYGTGSIYFNGTNQSLTFASSSTFAFGTSNFTIECWYYPVSRSSTWPTIWGNPETYPTNCFAMNDRHNQHQSVFAVTIGNYQPANEVAIIGSITVVDKTWYHLAVVRNGTSIKMYVNGVLDGSITYSGSVDNNSAEAWFIGGAASAWTNSYIDDFRITKGVARYTTNFTPPVAPLPTASSIAALSIDPAYPAVSLLLTGDTLDVDANRANVSLMLTGDDFIDWSNQHNAITNNSVTLTTSNKKFNSSAYSFSGSNYLSYYQSGATPAPISFVNDTSTNGTIECWIYPTSVASDNSAPYYATPIVALGSTYFSFAISNAYKLRYYWWTGSASSFDSTGTVSLNTWTHVAIVKSGSTVTFYINGVASGSGTNSAIAWSSGAGGEYLYVGFTAGSGTSRYFNGQIADLRITNGIARTITVPTAALPSYRIVDKSTAALAITPYGNVQLSTTQKKYGTTSLYFDGTGDYITLPASAGLDFGTGDLTIELWFYWAGASWSTNNDLIGSLGYYTVGKNGNWMFNVRNSTAIAFAIYNGQSDTSGSAWDYTVPTISVQAWHHVALVRSNGLFSVYLDGVKSVTTVANASAMSDGGASGIKIGGLTYPSNTYWNGYIADFRFTKGVARYTTHFVPPTAALPTTS
jgi:hypothetical protein